MIILGIDPGTAITGYGLIENTKDKPRVIDFGCILTESHLPQGERLKKINLELNKIINRYNPAVLAIENVYFFKNLKTVMPVSQAKGVIMFTAAKKNIPIFEYTPLQVKMTVAGYGRAEKKQVQKMIKVLLDLDKHPKSDDAADALGVALCYLFQERRFS